MGQCDWVWKVIKIDVDQHKSDREVRSTLLHEMAHAAACICGSCGHDLKFFAEVENLLRLRGPIAIDIPEAGGVRILSNLVPSRFPLLKRKIDRLQTRRNRSLNKPIAERNLHAPLVSDHDILGDFEQAATELTWKRASSRLGFTTDW
jgi:hypothetical protein